MTTPQIETERLNLVLQSHEEALAQIEQMKPEDKAQLSPTWLALLGGCTSSNPWIHGFVLVHRITGETIGSCGFKGPPDAERVVEIAYGINPEEQNQGYATEAARALVRYALRSSEVQKVRAHTLPESNASGRVLTKAGFRHVGEVIDPDDGLVWRWETP